MTNATRERSTLSEAPLPRQNHRAGLLAVLIGLAGSLVSFVGSWIPSFWGDEAASVMSAERPLHTLWPELGRVDAVHGTYYLFLHFWIEAFGASELSVRLPSAIAVGFAVAGVVVLATRLTSVRVGVIAGIVMAVIPRTTYMGAEGRSYAIGTAIAVWLTVLLVRLVASRSTRTLPWVVYGVLVAISIYVFLYLALLAAAHLVYLLLSRGSVRADGDAAVWRRMLRRWFTSVILAVVLAAPLLFFGLSQHGQISFLAHRHYVTFERLVVLQWFGNRPLALVGWALVIAGLVIGFRRAALRHQTALIAGWMLIPPVALLFVNYFIAPSYTIRYLSFATPAVAILVAIAVAAVPRSWARVGIVVLIVALAAPTWAAQRGQYAKDSGADFRQTAETVHAHAQPGQAIVFDQSVSNSRKPRLALHLYPHDFVGLKDVGLVVPFQQTSGLWDVVQPAPASALAGVHTVWAVESTTDPAKSADIRHLAGLGYAVVREYPVHRTTVYELSLETSS